MGIVEKIFGKKRVKKFRNEGEKYSMEIPTDWRLVSVTDAYGHSFSDESGKQGMLSIKPVIIPGTALKDYYNALLEGITKELKYKFFGSVDTTLTGHAAKEVVFIAPAKVDGKKKRAIMTTTIIDDSENYRFLVMTFTALESEYEKNIQIYTNVKKTFRIF